MKKDVNQQRQLHEQVCRNKVHKIFLIFDARDELSRVVTSNVDTIAPGFRIIYQVTIEDNLDRFDIFYSPDAQIANTEKMELGLRLMEKRNVMRTLYKGQNKTFETSSGKKIAVYFPRSDDNTSDNKYSYPRAAVHTARILSTKMFEKRMAKP